jgi:hypothetical protein
MSGANHAGSSGTGGLFSASAEQTYDKEKTEFFTNIRAFIASFFGCEECRAHFLEDFDAGAYRREEKDYPLDIWLWEFHQRVTLRIKFEQQLEAAGGKDIENNVELAAEKAAVARLHKNRWYPIRQAQLWPALPDCPACYQAILTGSEAKSWLSGPES